jgi:hypothetical protein
MSNVKYVGMDVHKAITVIVILNTFVHPSQTWVTYLTDQLWNPSPRPNVINETKS